MSFYPIAIPKQNVSIFEFCYGDLKIAFSTEVYLDLDTVRKRTLFLDVRTYSKRDVLFWDRYRLTNTWATAV